MASTSKKRKISTRTYDEKLDIINFVDENPNMKKKDVAIKFGIPANTLTDILKKRDKIQNTLETTSDGKKDLKRVRLGQFEDVDAALILWFRQMDVRPELRLEGDMLYEKAKYFAREFQHETPPSMAWVDRFKKRHCIAQVQKSGESAGVNQYVVQNWKDGKLRDILNRYSSSDIFNADETALFWQILPDKSLGFLGKSYHGGKQAKTRITVLVCASMDGHEKLQLYVIGKSKKPRAFKNVRQLPVEYVANTKAWMTSDLFENWVRKLDNRMRLKNRKIALIIDNCPAHPVINNLQNVELVFLPPNTTSVTQPMDGGIIKNMKLHYRRIVSSRRLAAAENDVPWNHVSAECIANVHRKVGFVVSTSTDDDEVGDPFAGLEEDDDPLAGPERELRNIWDRYAHIGVCKIRHSGQMEIPSY